MPIKTPEQWAVIASPVRFEILEAMRELGPCGIREIAVRLGVKPDRLYRHFEALVEQGFIVRIELRKSRRHAEQVFDLSADDFEIDFGGSDRASVSESVRQTAETFQKMARSVVDGAADARLFDLTRGQFNALLFCGYSWLTKTQFRRIHALCREIKSIVEEGRRTREGELYLTMLLESPVADRGVLASREKSGVRKSVRTAAGDRGRKE